MKRLETLAPLALRAARRTQWLAAGIIATLMVLQAAPVQAQAAGEVLRPWHCLTNSSAFGVPFTPPGCTVPAVNWSGSGRSSAINPPGTPAGLAATVTGNTVVLTWTRPSSGGTPTSYLLQAGSASGSANLVSANTESALPTLTATNVPRGTYFFRVLALSASGTGVASNEISVSVGVRPVAGIRAAACTTPPPSTGLTKIQNGNISVTFTWVAGEGECQAFALPTGYSLEYGFAPGQTAGALALPAQPTSITVSLVGVGAGTYYVRVRGVNGFGASTPSNEVVLQVGGVCSAPPLPPTNLSSSVAGSTVVLAWGESSAASNTPTAYRVTAGLLPGGNVAQFGSSGTVFRLAGVPAGSYYFRAQGVNSCGTSGFSNEVFVTVGGSAVPVTVTGVHQFAGAPTDGANRSTIIQGSDGNFYGNTVSGGPINPRCVANLEGCGTIFRMTPAGAVTILHAFGSGAPLYPYSRLLEADGFFWGTTTGAENGTGAGALYKMTAGGSLTVVSELGGPSYSGLVRGPDGSLYGTTIDNGPGTCSWRSTQCTPSSGRGTVFKYSGGTLTYLHTFGGADGSKPYAGLVYNGADGAFYGTTSTGGTHNAGTIYKITPSGGFTNLYSFKGGADGANPAHSALMRASDGHFYGTTQFGGGSANAGTIFRMTSAGAVAVLHGFTGIMLNTGDVPPDTAMDGLQPGAGLFEGPDGVLYGLTGGGGGFGGGTAFGITKAGAYNQLYPFSGASDGGSPTDTLILGNDGNLWGTAQYGGTSNRGVVFKMTLPR